MQEEEDKVKVGFKKVHPDAKLPTYAHEGDAGMDVCAVEDVDLLMFTPTLVNTGLVADIPEGYEIQVRPRSGLALKYGITVWNSPGSIDSGYRGQIGIILLWSPYGLADKERRKEGVIVVPEKYTIKKGERIAQLVLSPVTTCAPVEVQDVSETERGSGGFGSTGI